MKTVITYKNADLDCVASAYAYSEFLNKINDKCNYFIGELFKKKSILFAFYLILNLQVLKI